MNRLTANDSGKWRYDEDALLLRGFAVYGEKWALIGIFFLPGRSKNSIERRWQVKHHTCLFVCVSVLIQISLSLCLAVPALQGAQGAQGCGSDSIARVHKRIRLAFHMLVYE